MIYLDFQVFFFFKIFFFFFLIRQQWLKSKSFKLSLAIPKEGKNLFDYYTNIMWNDYLIALLTE
jgi:hypothetical protein